MATSTIKQTQPILRTQVFTIAGKEVAAGRLSDYDTDISLSGYKFLGILDFAIFGGDTCSTVSVAYMSSINAVRYRLRNNGTAAHTPDSVQFKCLYVKNS